METVIRPGSVFWRVPAHLPRLDEHRGRYPKALRKPLDLPRIQFAPAGQHLGDYPLAANLRQVGLPQVVLLHQKLEYRGRLGLGNPDMFRLVFFNKDSERISQLRKRVFLVLSNLVEDRIQHLGCTGVVFLRAQRAERHHGPQPTVFPCHFLHLVSCHDYSFHRSRSYSACVSTCRM